MQIYKFGRSFPLDTIVKSCSLISYNIDFTRRVALKLPNYFGDCIVPHVPRRRKPKHDGLLHYIVVKDAAFLAENDNFLSLQVDRQTQTKLRAHLLAHLIWASLPLVLALLGFELLDPGLHLVKLDHENRWR